MEKFAFVMHLHPGKEEEYKKRHDEIWPELVSVLKAAGVSDYSIYLETKTNQLFAVLKRDSKHTMDDLPALPIVQKWWAMMADVMETNPDNSPKVTNLSKMFHLE